MSCRATSWWATTGRARAASSASHPPMPAGRPACITVRSHPEAGAFFTRSTTTMLETGNEHLQSLRDGRVIYIGSEKVDDVTTHPAFRNGARSIAEIYDMKAADPRFSFKEGKERYSAYLLRAKTREDLLKRTQLHRAIADMSHGLLGRSPDHVSSFVTGMAMNPAVFGEFEKNLLNYYEHMRREDVYGVYAVIPPQAARNPEFYQKQNLPVPTLRVVGEDDAGVVISGMKMLATGAVFANEIWIGNLIPLAPNQLAESITCAIPVNSPGVALWSRKPFERHAPCEFENPLAWRFDETDSMVMCENVSVPWEKVFVHMYAALNWCTESHSQIIDALRELCGGGIFQMPADITVMHDPALRQQFETYWQTPQLAAVERMKLYKLAWDLIGSEFAGRHQQYEKFYAGASFIVRNHSFREAPWAQFHKVVDDLMAGYDIPEIDNVRKAA